MVLWITYYFTVQHSDHRLERLNPHASCNAFQLRMILRGFGKLTYSCINSNIAFLNSSNPATHSCMEKIEARSAFKHSTFLIN
ncbi:MAG: hypothetical protein A3I66_08915 [Burkholderiales bacterium RIFCSPLOWO2_02_FULL_57_36]|nr:MAG: hypothetical protein A3I66_08915 [Burkholderiales bacterium RIFCSPLOWO2_02_FULL_57_36]